MPDISKINALAIGSVSKVDGLAKASILDINGVAVTTPVPAPAAAYSVRLLGSAVGISSYTGAAMRVRRDTAGGTGDNDEADVAFDSGVISLDSAVSNFSGTSNATNLGQFLNATGYTDADSLTVIADGFVDEWKDQSGNGNDATQATFGSQPQIFDSASPTDLNDLNGNPVLHCYSRRLAATNPSGVSTMSLVANRPTVGSNRRLVESRDATSTRQALIGHSGTTFFVMYQESDDPVTPALANGPNLYEIATSAGQYLYFSASNTSSFCNGQAPTTTNGSAFTFGSTLNTLSINGRTNGQSMATDFEVQELIIWATDADSNRTGIETDINGFFGIY